MWALHVLRSCFNRFPPFVKSMKKQLKSLIPKGFAAVFLMPEKTAAAACSPVLWQNPVLVTVQLSGFAVTESAPFEACLRQKG